MSFKGKFNEFDLDSNQEYIVTISSDSESENVSSEPPEVNGTQKSKSSSLLENISSDEEEFDLNETKYKWFTVSLKLPPESEHILEYKKIQKQSSVKQIILDTILQNVEPFQFIPYLYSEYKGFHNFHVFDCEDALKKLLSKDYVCISKDIRNFSFKLKISPSDYSKEKVNINYLIKTVLKRRIDKEKKSLDLSIKNTFYLPLWYVGNQTMITSKIEKLIDMLKIRELNLSSNDISDFEGFNVAVKLSNLQSIDLTHNKIYQLKELLPFRGLNLKTLHLEYNPICHNYITKMEYVQAVKLIFPTVQILDNNEVHRSFLPRPIRNFTVDVQCTPLIDKFMLIYFTLFDSDDRGSMMHLYTKNSIFSINCDKSDLMFHKRSRNLLDSNSSNLYVGPRSIIGCLCWIPSTEHLPLSFSVDVIDHSFSRTIFNIHGTFILTSTFNNKKSYNFVRTFVIIQEENEYKISNDMLNVISSPSGMIPSGLQSSTKNSKKLNLTPSEDISQHTKDELINILMRLTKLGKLDAICCLERAKWNFRNATELAIDVLKRFDYSKFRTS